MLDGSNPECDKYAKHDGLIPRQPSCKLVQEESITKVSGNEKSLSRHGGDGWIVQWKDVVHRIKLHDAEQLDSLRRRGHIGDARQNMRLLDVKFQGFIQDHVYNYMTYGFGYKCSLGDR